MEYQDEDARILEDMEQNASTSDHYAEPHKYKIYEAVDSIDKLNTIITLKKINNLEILYIMKEYIEASTPLILKSRDVDYKGAYNVVPFIQIAENHSDKWSGLCYLANIVVCLLPLNSIKSTSKTFTNFKKYMKRMRESQIGIEKLKEDIDTYEGFWFPPFSIDHPHAYTRALNARREFIDYCIKQEEKA